MVTPLRVASETGVATATSEGDNYPDRASAFKPSSQKPSFSRSTALISEVRCEQHHLVFSPFAETAKRSGGSSSASPPRLRPCSIRLSYPVLNGIRPLGELLCRPKSVVLSTSSWKGRCRRARRAKRSSRWDLCAVLHGPSESVQHRRSDQKPSREVDRTAWRSGSKGPRIRRRSDEGILV